jgi:predicted anti-sigma-YlaC factor YlaD
MLSCREVTRLVSDAHERPLGLQERFSLRMHMTMCSACRRFEQQMATIRAAMHRLAQADAPSEGPAGPDAGAPRQ